jgi:hypothetical protein
MKSLFKCAALTLCALFVVPSGPVLSSQQTCGAEPNTASNKIIYPMYLNSKPQDAMSCSLSIQQGKIIVASPVTNPSMSCPDLFAWKLFAEAVQQEFWKHWAADQQTWPGVVCPNGDPKCAASNPLPICKTGESGPDCCLPGSKINPGYDDAHNPAKYCPYFPGDHYTGNGDFILPRGFLPSKAHQLQFATLPEERAKLMAVDPGRKIRQSMAEIVYRNKPRFNYVFENDLYNQDGIMTVFNRNSDNLAKGAPYRVNSGPANLAEIDFPPDAVMIKSDWLSKERAEQLGLRDDPEAPYIKMTITSPVTDNNGTILQPGEHWLVALHISSKDIPQWEWATFEHINNPGRCDYTGCNDSYGYTSSDPVKPVQAKNFTTPHVKCDSLDLPSFIFDPNKPYPSGPINGELAKAFAALGIGASDAHGPVMLKGTSVYIPSRADKAWYSYRLKGSQTGFVDNIGHPTHLGNSITEGGFASTSSCITCHARAGTTSKGTLPPALGVFINELDDTGYLQSARGTPLPDWFLRSRTPIQLDVLQTDFVWGFLTANPLSVSSQQKELKLTIPEEPIERGASARERTGVE